MPQIGIHVDNRRPFLGLGMAASEVVDVARTAEQLGFHSVWVGDGAAARPRIDPVVTLAAIGEATERVLLGTSCLITPLRNAGHLAAQWASLDHLSGGRTVLGACMGPLHLTGGVTAFEASLSDLRAVWEKGDGLRPHSERVPIWVVGNPFRDAPDPRASVRMERIADRVAQWGDGWMTCCRATHPEEARLGAEVVRARVADAERDPDGVTVSYHVVMSIGDEEASRYRMLSYLQAYYGHTQRAEDRGPCGPASRVREWLGRFAAAGVDHFICRLAGFSAAEVTEQMEQLAGACADWLGGRSSAGA